MALKRRAIVLICLLVTVFGFLAVPARADALPVTTQPAGPADWVKDKAEKTGQWFSDSAEDYAEWFYSTRLGKEAVKAAMKGAKAGIKAKNEGKSTPEQIWETAKGTVKGSKNLPGTALDVAKDAASSASPTEIMKSAITDALTDGFGQLAATAFDGVIGFITKPLSWLLAMLGKMWINFTPILPDSAMGAKVTNKTLSSFSALAGLLMVCSLMIGAAKIVITQRGEPLRDIARGLFTFVLMSSGWVSVCVLGLAGTDALASWIAKPVKPDGLAKMVGFLAVGTGPASGPLAFGLMSFVLIIFVLIISLILMFQLALRGGILLILAGMGPIAASFASTKIGWEWCQKIVAWTVAFMLFKPVGALIWSAALTLCNTPIKDINDATSVTAFALTPLALLLGCVFAMPALMKLVMPATASALGSSDSSAGGMAAGMFGGALAGGASVGQFKMMSKMMGSPGSSASGASGASDTGRSGGAGDASGAGGSSGAPGNGASAGGSSSSASGASNAGAASNAGSAGAAGSGAAGAAGGGAAAGGAAAGGASAGATAGAAAGPVGIVAGAAVGAAADGAKKAAAMTADAARSTAEGAVEYK